MLYATGAEPHNLGSVLIAPTKLLAHTKPELSCEHTRCSGDIMKSRNVYNAQNWGGNGTDSTDLKVGLRRADLTVDHETKSTVCTELGFFLIKYILLDWSFFSTILIALGETQMIYLHSYRIPQRLMIMLGGCVYSFVCHRRSHNTSPGQPFIFFSSIIQYNLLPDILSFYVPRLTCTVTILLGLRRILESLRVGRRNVTLT